jgi:hypothetical protein
MLTLPWIVVVVSLIVTVVAVAWGVQGQRPRRPGPLPNDWALSPRPVFSTDERRVYRLLREALPQHIVLSKLPMVRFCQPTDPTRVRYWYDLLGSIHVTFAVCSANGRVLAAIDLENDRANSRRVLQIKQAVLGACRVRYLRCAMDRLPSAAELQLLVPQSATTARVSMPPATNGGQKPLHQARDNLSSVVASRRAERSALWQDSTFFQDSFFAADSRADGFGGSENGSLSGPSSTFGALRYPSPTSVGQTLPNRPGDDSAEDVAGIVVETPRYATSSRH